MKEHWRRVILRKDAREGGFSAFKALWNGFDETLVGKETTSATWKKVLVQFQVKNQTQFCHPHGRDKKGIQRTSSLTFFFLVYFYFPWPELTSWCVANLSFTLKKIVLCTANQINLAKLFMKSTRTKKKDRQNKMKCMMMPNVWFFISTLQASI